MSNCLGCEHAALQLDQEKSGVKQQAISYGEKNKVDTVLYQSPEGWHFIEASKAAGLPVRELILYSRSPSL